MSSANHHHAPASSRAASTVNSGTGHVHSDAGSSSGHHHHHHEAAGTSASTVASNNAKKSKSKKATDPNEASKLIAAKIAALEQDAAGEKDQEAEIGACSLQFTASHGVGFPLICSRDNVAIDVRNHKMATIDLRSVCFYSYQDTLAESLAFLNYFELSFMSSQILFQSHMLKPCFYRTRGQKGTPRTR